MSDLTGIVFEAFVGPVREELNVEELNVEAKDLIGNNPNVHPLAFLEREEGRAALQQADLLFGHDEAQGGKPVLFFGRALLRRIVGENKGRPVKVFGISCDSRTDQLEWLCAAVTVLKGHCGYEDEASCN
jgi:hypothetical protein